MKDSLQIRRKKEKQRKSIRCSRCGRFMLPGMMLNGLCEKCADHLLAEMSELLGKERYT